MLKVHVYFFLACLFMVKSSLSGTFDVIFYRCVRVCPVHCVWYFTGVSEFVRYVLCYILQVCQSKPECSRQSLTELLIRPVQRLPSVSLLLGGMYNDQNINNSSYFVRLLGTRLCCSYCSAIWIWRIYFIIFGKCINIHTVQPFNIHVVIYIIFCAFVFAIFSLNEGFMAACSKLGHWYFVINCFDKKWLNYLFFNWFRFEDEWKWLFCFFSFF